MHVTLCADILSMMTTMDATDQQLVALLRENARLPIVALARQLRVARATVQNRIARLEREGVIVGYTVRLRPDAEPHQIRAIMSIAIEGTQGNNVRRLLLGQPHVAALHTTNGRWDMLAELRADSLEAFDRVLNTIRQTPGISNTETSILLSTLKL